MHRGQVTRSQRTTSNISSCGPSFGERPFDDYVLLLDLRSSDLTAKRGR